MANKRSAGSYGEANLRIGMANEEGAGVRQSEFVYRDSEQKACGESVRAYGEANLYIDMANESGARVRRSEPMYRDGEQKRRVRTEKRTYVSGWRTKASRAYGEANLCIGMANESGACVYGEANLCIGMANESGSRVYGEANLYIGMTNEKSASVRRSESAYRDGEQKKRKRMEKRACISG